MTTLDFYADILRIWLEPLRRLLVSPAGRFIVSILVGMVGAVLLLIFASFLVDGYSLKKLLPWFLGFNGSMTGFNFVDKTGGLVRRKWLLSALAGMIMVIPPCLLFGQGLGYPAEISWNGWLLSLGIGGLSGPAGAWIATRALALKEKTAP